MLLDLIREKEEASNMPLVACFGQTDRASITDCIAATLLDLREVEKDVKL